MDHGLRTTDGRMRKRAWRIVVCGLSSVVLFAACEVDRQSEAGTFRDNVSEAGTFDDSARLDAEAEGAGAEGAALAQALDAEFSPGGTLGYARARDALYAWENGRGGVCGLYTEFCVTLGPGDPSQAAMRLGINAEHVWPQSKGARQEPLKSDLHHLFPEREGVNSSRGNLPFGEVPDARADAWYFDDQSQSRLPRDPAGWSERGIGRWEPREDRKGDVARAVFYVAAVYPEAVDPTFFPPMRETLLAWNRADPPDDRERQRSRWIAGLQGTENPFVLDPSLADQIWGQGAVEPPSSPLRVPRPSSEPAPGDGVPGSQTGLLQITEIHYDNAGQDVGEGVEVSGSNGATLGGWTLVFVNGSGGEVYRTVSLSGTLDGGAVWVPVEGVQNGSPDGVALLDPSGRTAEAWSWEGAMTGQDGTRFRDLGVAQASDTASGMALLRVGDRWTLGPASPGRVNGTSAPANR